jgi:hypothetical protein
MELSDQLHALAALPLGEDSPHTHWIWGWVGTRAGLDSLASAGNRIPVSQPYWQTYPDSWKLPCIGMKREPLLIARLKFHSPIPVPQSSPNFGSIVTEALRHSRVQMWRTSALCSNTREKYVCEGIDNYDILQTYSVTRKLLMINYYYYYWWVGNIKMDLREIGRGVWSGTG